MLDAMFGARGGACCLLVAVAGCLAAPPTSGPDDCAPLVRNRFDDPGQWKAYSEPGADVSPAADAVWLSAFPIEAQNRSYADLRSILELPMADSELAAALVAYSEGGVAGIAWNRDVAPGFDDDDYYDLVVDGGILMAVRKPSFGEHAIICADCPAYDPERHAHMRLGTDGDEVVYQVSGDGRSWTDLARAPLAEGLYRAVAFVYADAPGASDLEVTEMTWTACER
jgi:hypothetical protein